MTDFRIWGRIEHVGPREFIVIVSAVPDSPFPAPDLIDVATQPASSRAAAVEACADLVLQMGKRVRERGDRVVDVEDD